MTRTPAVQLHIRYQNDIYQRVWVHKNGGQAELWSDPVRLSRLESWKSIEELANYLK